MLSTNERSALSHVTSQTKRQFVRYTKGLAGRLVLNVKCHYFERVGVFQRRIRANTRAKSNVST